MSGRRQAVAALLEVRGETVRLRKWNGKIAEAPLREFGPADRRYIEQIEARTPRPETVASPRAEKLPAPNPQTVAAQAKSSPQGAPPNVQFPALNDLLNSLVQTPSLLQTPSLVQTPPPTENPTALPASLVYVQLSRDFLRQYIAPSMQTDEPVTDNILGTSITGQARTNGTIDLVLEDNSRQAIAGVTFVGTVRSRTLGYNGPLVVHNDAQTEFQARKQLVFAQDGLHILPAVTSARTYSVTTGMQTLLPGLRGRIAQRIGWQRAAESRPQANVVVAQHAEQRISSALDQRVNQSAPAVRQMLMLQVPRTPYQRDRVPPMIHFSSTPSHIHMVVYRSEATNDEQKVVPPPIQGQPDVAVRIHRQVVHRAIAQAEVGQALTPILNRLLGQGAAKHSNAATSGESSGAKTLQYDATWSPDRDWLVITYAISRASPAVPLAAH